MNTAIYELFEIIRETDYVWRWIKLDKWQEANVKTIVGNHLISHEAWEKDQELMLKIAKDSLREKISQKLVDDYAEVRECVSCTGKEVRMAFDIVARKPVNE